MRQDAKAIEVLVHYQYYATAKKRRQTRTRTTKQETDSERGEI